MKKILKIFALIALMGFVQGVRFPNTPGDIGGPIENYTDTIAFFHMDGLSGDFINDSAHVGAGTALECGVVPEIQNGFFNLSVWGNGTSGICASSDSGFECEEGCHISIWVNRTGLMGGSVAILSKSNPGCVSSGDHNGYNICYDVSGDGFQAYITNDTVNKKRKGLTLKPSSTVGEWVHLGLVWNRTNATGYLNGLPVDTASYNLSNYEKSAADFEIFTLNGARNFNGSVDEVGVWALRLGEVDSDSFMWDVYNQSRIINTIPVDGLESSDVHDFNNSFKLHNSTPTHAVLTIFEGVLFDGLLLFQQYGDPYIFPSPGSEGTLSIPNILLEPNVYLYIWRFNGTGADYSSLFVTYTQSSYPDNSLETGGNCFTDKGFSYVVDVGDGIDWMRFNLEDLGGYLSNRSGDGGVNMSNVWTNPASSFKFADYQLLTDTRFVKNFTLYVAGHNFGFNHSEYSSPVPNVTLALDIDDFTRGGRIYFLDVHSETNNSFFTYENVTKLDLITYCTNYAPETIDLTDLDQRSIMLATKEESTFQGVTERLDIFNNTLNVSIGQQRKKVGYDVVQNLSMYLTEEFQDLVNYFFVLEDFTGSYRANGLLRISKNINGTIQPIHTEKWFYDQITELRLLNDSSYLIEVFIPGVASENYGWITIAGEGFKTITVTDTVLIERVNHFEGLYYTFLQDSSVGVVGLYYNDSTGSVETVTFTVSNLSSQVYQVSSSANSGRFIFVLPNNETNYVLRFDAEIAGHSTFIDEVNIRLGEAIEALGRITAPGMFNKESSKVQFFTVWLFLGFVGLIAGPANVGIIVVLFFGTAGLFYWMNWLNDYRYLIYTTMILVGIIIVYQDRKKEVEL
jgi:hypothetical protein